MLDLSCFKRIAVSLIALAIVTAERIGLTYISQNNQLDSLSEKILCVNLNVLVFLSGILYFLIYKDVTEIVKKIIKRVR